ncbi:Thymidine kinase [Arcanobacterium haemolyticum]|uniref:thymidine kinase n=1 Tax=Arcanobacterium haemolyticum TaxID=28264 RepID=UPI000D8B38CE|nr:thymidine kinase [Arcanobacterium haemolyticum]SPT75029.1 Thymidine kinase [Arcanobacterium haemolyticum]
MAELVFFSGTMDCGKSTLALQTAYNYEQRGLGGIIFAMKDRAGHGKLSSRLGLETDAIEVTPETNFWEAVGKARQNGERVDFIICDEVQFYSREQVDQLARIVDEIHISVWGFGITTDFLTRLFPGSARMLELADRVERLQVEALCWCGKRATHNARTINGMMVTEGEQVMVGDTKRGDVVGYEVLCRYHHMHGMTAASEHASEISPTPLTFGSH